MGQPLGPPSPGPTAADRIADALADLSDGVRGLLDRVDRALQRDEDNDAERERVSRHAFDDALADVSYWVGAKLNDILAAIDPVPPDRAALATMLAPRVVDALRSELLDQSYTSLRYALGALSKPRPDPAEEAAGSFAATFDLGSAGVPPQSQPAVKRALEAAFIAGARDEAGRT